MYLSSDMVGILFILVTILLVSLDYKRKDK